MLLEIACFEITSAETALKSVADRIEFCSEITAGGLTPNIDEFRYLKSVYVKPIYVMIRPKGGSFIYTDLEFAQMAQDIIEFKNSGADGFVFGILESGNTIDMEKNRELVELAFPLPCTFHRAVDRTPDIDQSIQQLIDLKFNSVLTSGGKNSAMEGRDKLREITEKYGHAINILVGGGVRSGNISQLIKETGARHFHSSAIPDYEIFASDEEIKNLRKYL